MSGQKHIIRTQTIAVEMAKSTSVVAVQDKVKQVYYDKVLPQLDVLFSNLVTNEIIIRIDKLDVDVGNIYKEEFEQLFVERTIESVEKQLTEKLKFDVNTSSEITTASTVESAVEELIYFLSHGYFSWRNQHKKVGLIEDIILRIESKSKTSFANTLISLFKEKPYTINRLVISFSDRFLQYIISCFAPAFSSQECLEIIQVSFADDALLLQKKAAKIFFWKDVFTNIQTIKNDSELHLLFRSLAFAAAIENRSLHELLQSIDEAKLSVGAIDLLRRVIEKEVHSITKDKPVSSASNAAIIKDGSNALANNDVINSTKNKKNNSDIYPNKQDNTTDKNVLADDKVPGSLNEPELIMHPQKVSAFSDRKKEGLVTQEPIFLELAGLVILHSFLNTFFDTLGLTKDRLFCNEASLHKAIQLTGYLATGETQIEEHFLVLPKLLCGIDFTEPVENNISISDKEKVETDALLKQVIAYWPALKNTSVEGLRHSFLKREGKLTRAGLGWQLDVEHKTWDILLSKSSWGFSLIKLPWMKEFLFVNWS